MPELRWTLLIVGAVFVIGLALWEIRRQRQVPRQGLNPGAGSGAQSGSDRMAPTLESGGAGHSVGDGGRLMREPTITLPELQPADGRVEPRMSARGREAVLDPQIIEVEDVAFSQLRVSGETASRDAIGDLSIEGELPEGESFSAEPPPDSDIGAMRVEDTVPSLRILTPRPERETASAEDESPAYLEPYAPADSAGSASQKAEAAVPGPESSTGFVTADADIGDTAIQPVLKRELHAAGASADGAPVVDWPGETQRKIVALRLVSAPAARFPGRAVRQALAAEGFVLGKFDIFHKAGPDERAVLSAASLTKPGTFALNTIDAQRFGGISLFAVLPGPLPAQATFDQLLTTARSLNDRLQGALQDERGEPLTPVRSATIRQSLSEGDRGHGEDAGSETLQ